MSEWDNQILFPGAELYRVQQFMAGEGIVPAQWLVGTGIAPEDLKRPELRVSFRQFDYVYRNVFRLCRLPAVGYRLGRSLNLSRWGMVASALVFAKTLGHALIIASQYRALLRSRFTLEPLQQGQWMILRISRRPGMTFPVSEPFALEMLVGTLQSQISDLLAQPFSFSRIDFSHAEPPHVRRLRDLCGADLSFSCGESALFLPTQLMTRPLPLANPVAQRQALSLAERELDRLRGLQEGDITWRVRNVLAEAIGDIPDMTAVALALHLSERTLRRKLTERGYCFRQLVKEHQIERARLALADQGTPLSEVVKQAGFKDEGSFRHCFRKLTGCSPAQFRKQLLEPQRTANSPLAAPI